jgi:hypothetical protein
MREKKKQIEKNEKENRCINLFSQPLKEDTAWWKNLQTQSSRSKSLVPAKENTTKRTSRGSCTMFICFSSGLSQKEELFRLSPQVQAHAQRVSLQNSTVQSSRSEVK